MSSSLHILKVGVQCGVSHLCVNGPLCFSEIVNPKCYQLIRQFISLLEEEKPDHWFHITEATAHTVILTIKMMQEFFGDCFTRCGNEVPRMILLQAYHRLTAYQEELPSKYAT
jgi:hypothetical protein